MKPYGQDSAYKRCQCEQCHVTKKTKRHKASERQRAKKEIRSELDAKKTDV